MAMSAFDGGPLRRVAFRIDTDSLASKEPVVAYLAACVIQWPMIQLATRRG